MFTIHLKDDREMYLLENCYCFSDSGEPRLLYDSSQATYQIGKLADHSIYDLVLKGTVSGHFYVWHEE